jgi:hypothetical protein
MIDCEVSNIVNCKDDILIILHGLVACDPVAFQDPMKQPKCRKAMDEEIK